MDSDGRYVVSLPWIQGHPPYPRRNPAKRRAVIKENSTTRIRPVLTDQLEKNLPSISDCLEKGPNTVELISSHHE
ncbi:hypothetical protein TNIN_77341 [Trichonephila inaurata madagascariensis]|uniref:Uncharacterized protein n=1 Tax=Trichonephila inaurata madagascariensis TaxID=2747483 RepID=A0A8X6Y4P2_9ARAC|nr:hypothetical protein TNIN_77341 [Trichonephila inaurata madagascariensis]